MRANELSPGDLVIHRDEQGIVFEMRYVTRVLELPVPPAEIMEAQVVSLWPNVFPDGGRADLESSLSYHRVFFGIDAELEVVRGTDNERNES